MSESETLITLDNFAQLYFVAPYWTSVTAIGVSPKDRRSELEKISEVLNKDQVGDQKWAVEKIVSPRTLQYRKFGHIVREFNFEDAFSNEIALLIGPESFAGICGRITYFDYGLGNIEIAIGFKKLDAAAFQILAAKLTVAKDRIVSELIAGVPNALIDLEELDRILGNYFRTERSGIQNQLRATYDEAVLSPDARMPGARMICGPVSRNILFTGSNGALPTIDISYGAIEKFAFQFLNEKNPRHGVTGSDRIPISHEGFEGAVSVVRRSQESAIRFQSLTDNAWVYEHCRLERGEVARTKLLWSIIQLYWAAMFSASEGLFAYASDNGEVKSQSLRNLTKEGEKLEQLQKIISMIRFESHPEKVTVSGEDRVRYMSIWNAYGTDQLLTSLGDIQADTHKTLTSIRERAQNLLRKRLNWIISTFTLLAVVSVIADVIALYDIKNQIPADERMAYLALGGAGLLGVGLLSTCAVYLWSHFRNAAQK